MTKDIEGLIQTAFADKLRVLKEKEKEYDRAANLESDPELLQNYIGRKLTYGHAIAIVEKLQADMIEVAKKHAKSPDFQRNVLYLHEVIGTKEYKKFLTITEGRQF